MNFCSIALPLLTFYRCLPQCVKQSLRKKLKLGTIKHKTYNDLENHSHKLVEPITMSIHHTTVAPVQFETELTHELMPPKKYGVYLLNDDFTTMDFVMHVLQNVFFMEEARAFALMLVVHEQGKGLCGVFNWDIATTKQSQVMDLAVEGEYPLQCTVEEATE